MVHGLQGDSKKSNLLGIGLTEAAVAREVSRTDQHPMDIVQGD